MHISELQSGDSDSNIIFNRNEYRLTEPVKVTDENLVIDGQGATLHAENPSETVLQITDGAKNVKIKNITLEIGSETSDTKINGIEIRDSEHISVEGCTIKQTPRTGPPGSDESVGGGSGICVRESSFNTDIIDCSVFDSGWRGIETAGVMTTIKHCVTTGQLDRGISGDVQLLGTDTQFDESAEQLLIEDCHAAGGPHPASPIGFAFANNVRVNKCQTIRGTGQRGIAARNSQGVVIAGCDLSGVEYDTEYSSIGASEGIFSTSDAIQIRDNNIQNFKYGVRMRGSNSIIEDNNFVDCEYSSVKRHLRRNRIENNICSEIMYSRWRRLVHEARLFARYFT